MKVLVIIVLFKGKAIYKVKELKSNLIFGV